jgi:thiol:disulfide interchange protein DsbD
VAVLAAAGLLVAAGPADDPFAESNREGGQQAKAAVGDPFAEANRAKALAEEKQVPAPSPLVEAPGKKDPTAGLIEFHVSVEPAEARPGQTVRVTIRGVPKAGYHSYPLTVRAPDQSPTSLVKLAYEPNQQVRPLWPVKESEPEFKNEAGVGVLLEHARPFTWTQDLLVLPTAGPGKTVLQGTIRNLVVCDESHCTPPATRSFEVPITVAAGPALGLSPELEKRLQEKEPPPATRQPPLGLAGGKPKGDDGGSVTDTAKAQTPDAGLLGFILQGVIWGALSLVTPCVFPMIPITVSYFLKQSEQKHHRALSMAAVYSGTIVVVLTVSGLLLSLQLQRFAQHWGTNLALGLLFLVFALSLFGMYEITLPSWLANLTSSREGRGGLLGTMFMALTFTVISFACVAPFYGGFISLTAAAASASDWARLALGCLAYSAVFAAPFFLLALFPSLLRSMPRSGSWMNSVKVVMGFLEVAAGFKFLRAAELTLFGKTDLLTYDMVLGIYVVLSIACGLYLLGLFRLPHDHDPVESLSVPRLLWSLAFLTLGLYLAPGLFKGAEGEQQRPRGVVFAWVDSFLLPEVSAEPAQTAQGGGKGRPSHRLDWKGDLEGALKLAAEQRKRVFLDFTGLN